MRGAGSRAASDRGSGGVLSLVIVLAAASLAAMVIAGSAAVAAGAKAASAADSAALAGASVQAGFADGEPCDAAARVGEVSGTAVVACHVTGTTVTVVCEVLVGGIPVLAASSAGQPTSERP